MSRTVRRTEGFAAMTVLVLAEALAMAGAEKVAFPATRET